MVAEHENAVHEEEEEELEEEHQASSSSSGGLTTVLKWMAASAFLYSAVSTYNNDSARQGGQEQRRQLLSSSVGDSIPSYMDPLMKDLRERQKLFEDTPPEEVKYWFEYAGPLQKYFYRFSTSRGKADYFEGRDDSGVTSSRFTTESLGGHEFEDFFTGDTNKSPDDKERLAHARLLENCLSMGSPARPDTTKGLWKDWFGSQPNSVSGSADRCRVLFAINTVGAGRGTTMLWETNPPPVNAQGPQPWTSEQETAATHFQRNLQEIDAMCAAGQVAARVQMLVCEPISAKWTEWMDSMLPHCGGKLSELEQIAAGTTKVEERPSPVQVVVVSTARTADTCHDLKSGFMEKRMQDLMIAPPFLGDKNSETNKANPTIKTTHPDLVSSDDHDLYIAMKWTSMISLRGVNSFLQASADLAAAASSPVNKNKPVPETNADGVTVAVSNAPSSPFLIPSFVRVSYVSEENQKVAKWRMHGDFFHPAAWEVCKDSYDMTWIDHSLSGPGGVNGICYPHDSTNGNDDISADMARKLKAFGGDCGQWWLYFAELQMPTSPEVYANEATPPLVQGGSNFMWMVTERQRREIAKHQVCIHDKGEKGACPAPPQAVMPLGDLESFLVNFTPNTALGKKHVTGRRPGYSRAKEHEEDREQVRERKQLKGQEDIEKALFDYTIYPAALFRKDATIKAARGRDVMLTKKKDVAAGGNAIGPQTVKSSYYDVTITKPRAPVMGWCQAIARKGLCTLYADYFRTSNDVRCLEACGMKKNWSPMTASSKSSK